MAGTKLEGAALAFVPLVGLGSAGICGCGNDRLGRSSGLCSLGRRGLLQPLWCRERQVSALLWPIFNRLACVQPPTLLVDTTVEGVALASDLLFVNGQPATVKAGTKGEGSFLDIC